VISNGDIYETNYGIAMVNGERLNQEIIKDETIEEIYTEPIPLGPEYPKFTYGDDKKFAFEAAKSTVLSVQFAPRTAIFPNEQWRYYRNEPRDNLHKIFWRLSKLIWCFA